MRKPIIAGNWKMNNTTAEAIELANGIKRELFDVASIDIVLCPPYTCLTEVAEVLANSNIKLGAQDLHWELQGAYTGEISGPMLKEAGCDFVIIGHSERRQYFGETNQVVNKKIKAALKSKLTPIVCLGENLNERETGRTFEIITQQLEESLEGLRIEDSIQLIIAYEPVWAIGTGKTATPDLAQEAQRFIRNLLAKIFDENSAKKIRIQYGGSVKPDNMLNLIAQEDIDGALVGGASLEIDSFTQIIRNCFQVKK